MLTNLFNNVYRCVFPKKEIEGSPKWFRAGEVKTMLSLLRELAQYLNIKEIDHIKLKYNNLITSENQKEIFLQLDKLAIDKKKFDLGNYFGIDYIETLGGKKFLYFKIYDRNVNREVIFKEIQEDIKFSTVDHDLLCYKNETIFPILDKSDKAEFKVNLDRIGLRR